MIDNEKPNIFLKILSYIITGLLIVMVYGFGWIVTCGIVKILSLCFGFKFTWLLATGFYLVYLILKDIAESITFVEDTDDEYWD
jgi:hypothetical protein